MKQNDYSAIVIGGGPGGSSVATLLSQFGHRVLVLEREVFPRYHIGESLLSGTAQLLEKLGVLDEIERAGYVKKFGVEWIWGKTGEPWRVYFKDALAMPYDYGYQVERAEFDKLLLDNAAKHGATVIQGCSVVDLLQDANGRVIGVEYQEGNGLKRIATAPWTIDASGQGGFITRRLGSRAWDSRLRNMAVWSYWKGARRGEGIDAGNTFLPAFDRGWWWFIPLRNDVTSIGAVIDREHYLKAHEQGLDAFYREAVSSTKPLADRLSNATMVEPIRVQRDWSYSYERFYGDGYVAVGDAACFIDPLFSTGVHLAMLSGYLAAVSLNTILREAPGRDAALSFFQREYEAEYKRLRAQVYFLYSGHQDTKESYFWSARSHFDMPNVAPERAFISLIAGAYEHRSWYRRYLSQLEVPPHLRNIVESIFDGNTVGPQKVTLHEPLHPLEGWRVIDDLAIRDDLLQPAKSIEVASNKRLALDGTLDAVLKAAEGGRSAAEIITHLLKSDVAPEQRLRQVVNEAISYGLLGRAGAQPSAVISASATES